MITKIHPQLIKLLSLLLILFSTIIHSSAQKKYTISGYVKDASSGETIIAANITLKGQRQGVITNQYGFWSLTLVEGSYQIITTHVGYRATILPINLIADTTINIALLDGTNLQETVVVTSTKRENNVKGTQMGKISLPIEKIKSVPAFLGEVDILKVIQLLPGVRNAGEGSSGIYVRGGGADQNLIILDEAVVYNTGHLFGFFSVFNADAIKNVTLIKGGMPAQYGGRLSSVLDVSMKEGNNQKYQVEGGIGSIAGRFSVQGPIKKDKASFIISGRRTYIDALVKPLIKSTSSFKGSGYYFYDLNMKVNYSISEKDKVYASGYFGRDVFDFVNGKQSFKVNIPWGNATGTVRWNHVFNNKLFTNTTGVFNDYNFTFNGEQNNFKIKLASGIRDFSIKQDYDYYPASDHKLKFGWLYTHHRFKPSVISGEQDSVTFNPQNAQIKFSNESAIYLQDDWEVSPKIKINAGLRYSNFQQVGPYKTYITDDDGNRKDSTVFTGGKPVKTYGGLEPRLSVRYAINDATSIKASATRNLQYIHLVSNSGTTLPTDIWVPSTAKVKPQISYLYAAGLFKNYNNNTYETSIEVYYKSMQNQIEYREGYIPSSLKDTEEDFVFGKGYSYGTELFINKTKGRFTGWIGYTLSYTYRKFAALNEGNRFAAKYDRRNDMSIVALYDFSKKWKLSATFVYGTGNATTLPQRFYLVGGVLTQEYSNINQYRLPSYHRLDLAATLTPKRNEGRKIKTEWVFSIYNAYSRKNPYFNYYDQTGNPFDGTLRVQAKQVSLFPIIPAVTYNFKF